MNNKILNQNTCTEIVEILKYIPIEYFKMLPNKLIKFLNDNKNNDYKFIYDVHCEFDNQKIMEETREVIMLLNQKYWNNNIKFIYF